MYPVAHGLHPAQPAGESPKRSQAISLEPIHLAVAAGEQVRQCFGRQVLHGVLSRAADERDRAGRYRRTIVSFQNRTLPAGATIRVQRLPKGPGTLHEGTRARSAADRAARDCSPVRGEWTATASWRRAPALENQFVSEPDQHVVSFSRTASRETVRPRSMQVSGRFGRGRLGTARSTDGRDVKRPCKAQGEGDR